MCWHKDKQKWLVGNGERIYFETCRSCHGANGRGQQLPGLEMTMAPSLVGSPRVKGDREKLLRILLQGLHGPVNGKVYAAGLMPPIASLGYTDSNRIAQVANYIRFAWGHNIPPMEVEVVNKVKNETKDRKTPWTLEELAAPAKAQR